MKYNNILLSGLSILLASPLATSSPISEEAEAAPLMKRNAWSVYLYSNSNCNTQGAQGGYSAFGSFGCTNIFSNSVDADTQGCIVTVYGNPGCSNPAHVYTSGDTCFGVLSPVGGALQSFKVDC
jgi:hypothetical protein